MEFAIGQKIRQIPPGDYTALVSDIDMKVLYKRNVLVIRFIIANGDHKGVELNSFINARYTNFSTATKLYKWFTIANRKELGPGETINTDVFLNKMFRVRVDDKLAKKSGGKFSNVTEIYEVLHEI